jgi:hypothetical protein
MAVNFTKKKPMTKKYQSRRSSSDTTDNTPFTRWYKSHREEFNEQRRKRYHSDPEYRQKMQEASRQVRQRRLVKNRPDQYCISLVQLAEILDVSVWTIRNWRKNGYFPEPYHDDNGIIWFTVNQLELIKKLQDYFLCWNIKRLSNVQKLDVELISKEIHANWRV